MSATFLEKLKEKKSPKMQESVVIAIPAAKKEQSSVKSTKPVSIKTKIVDKSKNTNFNRDEFIKTFRQLPTSKVTTTKPSIKSNIKTTVPDKKIEPRLNLSTIPEGETQFNPIKLFI